MKRPVISIYFSMDFDGPYGWNQNPSILFISASAYRDRATQILSSFEIRIKPRPETTPDPEVIAKLKETKGYWDYITKDPVEPAEAMSLYRAWLASLRPKNRRIVYDSRGTRLLKLYLKMYPEDPA